MRRLLLLFSFTLLLLMWTLSVSAQDGIDPNATPNFATLQLGGTDTYWLDPTLVSVVGGVLQGDSIKASSLNKNCTGIIPTKPDVVVNWKEDTTISKLRIFFLGAGDPTIVVVTPDGSTLCNDDVNPLVLSPMIEIEKPATGRYSIFMGSFEGDAIQPGFVVLTSTDLNPASMDLAAMVPAPNPEAVPTEKLPATVLLTDSNPVNSANIGTITSGFGKTIVSDLTSAGSLPAYNIDLGNDLCTGFVDAVPTYVFTYSGIAKQTRVFFEGDNDSTLMILSPDGSVTCNDDMAGADNLNPSVDLTPVEGRYVVYVGTFAPGKAVSGKLTITEQADAVPSVLTPADLPK